MVRLGLLVSLAAALVLGGCADASQPAAVSSTELVPPPPIEAIIPLPRDGDTATFSTETYRSLFEVHATWQGSPALGNVGYPMVTRAYAPLDDVPAWPPYREAIDPSSNRLVWSIDPCPFNLDGKCKGPHHYGYETWRSEVAGLPWAYGSSIFQGRVLREGLQFEETFPLGMVPITVTFEVVSAQEVDNETLFEVEGILPFVGNATEMIAGTWTLSSSSPYALEYRTNLTLAATKTSTFSFGINATLSEWSRGTGPEVIDPRPAYKFTAPKGPNAVALDGGLPVGADAQLGLDGYTFRGAWDHLLSQQPAIAEAARAPGFRLWNMQVPREETSGGALVFHEHYVEGSFSYFHGERFDSAFVSHDCSWVDVLDLRLSCDYSGTGPTSDTRGLRGNVSFDLAIDLREAHKIANRSLPRPASVFLFGTITNGVATPDARMEAYAFSFYFPLLDENGEARSSGALGHVRIDAFTGEVRSRTLENG